jgi:hypothetical protein
MEYTTFHKWVNGHRAIALDPEWEAYFIDHCRGKAGVILGSKHEAEGNDRILL